MTLASIDKRWKKWLREDTLKESKEAGSIGKLKATNWAGLTEFIKYSDL